MASQQAWKQATKIVDDMQLENTLNRHMIDDLTGRIADACDAAWAEGRKAGIDTIRREAAKP